MFNYHSPVSRLLTLSLTVVEQDQTNHDLVVPLFSSEYKSAGRNQLGGEEIDISRVVCLNIGLTFKVVTKRR